MEDELLSIKVWHVNRGSGAGQVTARWGNSGVLGTLGAVGTYLPR